MSKRVYTRLKININNIDQYVSQFNKKKRAGLLWFCLGNNPFEYPQHMFCLGNNSLSPHNTCFVFGNNSFEYPKHMFCLGNNSFEYRHYKFCLGNNSFEYPHYMFCLGNKKNKKNTFVLNLISAHVHLIVSVYGPLCDKTCLQGFRQSETQTSLLSYRE